MATESTIKSKTQQVAEAPSDIFGNFFSHEQIIEEFLTTNFSGHHVTSSELNDYLQNKIAADSKEENLIDSPFANWIEQYIALERKMRNGKEENPSPLQKLNENYPHFHKYQFKFVNKDYKSSFNK